MKKIKINTSVNLTSGLSIPSGSIVVISEGYADVKNLKDGFIPSQVATSLYASEAALENNATPVGDAADFNSLFSNLLLSEVDYETKTAESLLIDAVYNELNKIYPNQVEII
jgi:hypothetical protein